MMKKSCISIIWLILLGYSAGYAQAKVLYKHIDTTQLFMEVFQPIKLDTAKKYPAMVFFFGGGWNDGTTQQFAPHAKYFAQRGMICLLADYRVKKKHQTSPFEAVKDAKSAIRYMRAHAAQLHIDTSMIVAAGGSAGGHLAAATALLDDYNESTDDKAISCKPNALVLFNPVVDNGPNGYGYDRIGAAYKNFSPLHNISYGAPPTIIFLGTNDNLIPVMTAAFYQEKMMKVNSRCELILYEGQTHGFFNHKNLAYYKQTVAAADQFLQSLGYLSQQSMLNLD